MNKLNSAERAVNMCDGDLRAWIEQEAVHLKAIDSHGDPVELSADEVRSLAQQLISLAETMEN